jgi:hypothetical protein
MLYYSLKTIDELNEVEERERKEAKAKEPLPYSPPPTVSKSAVLNPKLDFLTFNYIALLLLY